MRTTGASTELAWPARAKPDDEIAGLMRVAVTGAGGRLGSALTRALSEAPFVAEVLAWDLPVHDLDDPASAERLVTMHRPDVVVHTAAWTDVDGCAREPGRALRRNGTAAGEMAAACAKSGSAMVLLSTNEVFDGRRTDGRPYLPTDSPNPPNPYGLAKLAGEHASRVAFGATADEFESAALGPGSEAGSISPALAIVRTAWLFGLPGVDFPQKILAAAERARAAGQALSVVSDEVGCPTYAPDLAGAIVAVLGEWRRPGGRSLSGIHHIVNAGHASRAEWARRVLAIAGIDVATNDVPLGTWPRPSTPPAWGVLAPTPLPNGPLRPWQDAVADHMTIITSQETRR
jgi:dTDP-4-dehydrorhamnose reductase